MKGFNFEKNLSHQENAVISTLSIFENLELHQVVDVNKNYVNPLYNKIKEEGNVFDYITLPDGQYYTNIKERQKTNNISEIPKPKSNIIDIMMETGTGKTYAYTKTIFELNKNYGIFKFIIVVPTLSIKAGTIDFLKSDSSRDHFKEQYGKILHLHIVESQTKNKSKKSFIPRSVTSFVNAGDFEKNSIQVMIINAGMINSDTMQKSFDKGLFEKYTVPFDAIGATYPFMIIDEPHKFGQGNKTWVNIQKMNPQFILRYGATFLGYENLIYELTAVDSFNRNLVKGVIGHITEFNEGQNALVKLVNIEGNEATFSLKENSIEKTFRLKESDSLSKIHSHMSDLVLEKISGKKNSKIVLLSNGKELRKNEPINPYSYAISLQEIMIQKAIKHHFEIERQLLTREVKIKPLTLFFIDNIDEYRNQEGYLRKTVEQYIKAEIKKILLTEQDDFYKNYLEKTLVDLAQPFPNQRTHGGYFSKDNTEKDEAIEKEINEILHDKQALLDLENPRRFIFSKWTLREGWDNPNVFQICKLRSSGSEISKLQEVGRGLRLPVNEFGNRVKDEQFYLNYFVDFNESDFVDNLVNEINKKSGAISIEKVPEMLTEEIIEKICISYEKKKLPLQCDLLDKSIIDEDLFFKEGGFDYIKQNFPRIFEGVNSNKVRKSTDIKKKVTIRTEKYQELKELWEKLNEKVILEYKFENELKFETLLIDFFESQFDKLQKAVINERIAKVEIKDNIAIVNEPESIYNRQIGTISLMKYSDFLKSLSKIININIVTLHNAIIKSKIEINNYLNQTTIRVLKQNFDFYLMSKAFDKFQIAYQNVTNSIHPTKLTDDKGIVLTDYSPSNDIGKFLEEDEKVNDKYFFEEFFYDSELEKSNIKNKIEEVIVFTKIPKNSIKIPVAGGKSYSPDFAYVLKFKGGEQKLNFIVETKDVNSKEGLRDEERYKIRHAEKFFGDKIKIEFRTQYSNDKIVDLINSISNPNP